VVLLLFAVLVPTVCLLWFMGAAMRNERFAVRQKMADAYRFQLSVSQAKLQQFWRETAAELEKFTPNTSAPAAFARCVLSRAADSVVILDDQGRILYPNVPSPGRSDSGELDPKGREGSQLEYLHKYLESASQYDAAARETTNENFAARMFQSEARSFARAGQTDSVIQLVTNVFSSQRYYHAADLQGRLIAANCELMVLELITNRLSPVFRSTALRLATRLTDYDNPVMAAPQRRFLMKELQRLSRQQLELPTLAAEELAAELIESRQNLSLSVLSLQRVTALPDLWQFMTPNRRVLAVLRSDTLMAATKTAIAADSLAEIEVSLAPPDIDTPNAFVTQPAGEHMPGWRLALSLKDRKFFDATAGRQAAVYLWTGIMVVVAMGVLTVITLRLLRRQMTVARLKNDLVATVSHELKTPLSSMRVLVDTLLNSNEFDQHKTREYLQLIAGENERLGRLIQNFLTFSRMERKKYSFHFSPVSARQSVDAAVASVRARLDPPDDRLEVKMEENLPAVTADSDALAVVLINLLENAIKYSDASEPIVLQVRAVNGSVVFSVIDNGIGIAPSEQKKIFQPFYQVDRHLSRKGSGCGLGLSIVRHITTAHGGRVSVESAPGVGSIFSITLPLTRDADRVRTEAIA